MNRSLAVFAVVLSAASSATAQKTQTISTFGLPAVSSAEADIGNGVIGQVFTVPKNAFKLISFSMYVGGGDNGHLLQFGFDISRWLAPFSEENLTGPGDIFEQPHLYSYPATLTGSATPIRFDFRNINLPVIPTKQYVAYISHGGPVDPFVAIAAPSVGDQYSQGGYFIDGAIQPVLDTDPDLMFEAEFTVTPEPTTLVLLATGLLGMGAIAVRSIRRKEESAN